MPISAYTKAIASFLATLAAAFVAANTDQVIEPVEAQQLFILGCSTALVVLVPVLPGTVGRYSKQLIAFLGAAAVTALPLFHGQFDDLNTWLLSFVAGLSAIGVATLPNEGYQARHRAEPPFNHGVTPQRY